MKLKYFDISKFLIFVIFVDKLLCIEAKNLKQGIYIVAMVNFYFANLYFLAMLGIAARIIG